MTKDDRRIVEQMLIAGMTLSAILAFCMGVGLGFLIWGIA